MFYQFVNLERNHKTISTITHAKKMWKVDLFPFFFYYFLEIETFYWLSKIIDTKAKQKKLKKGKHKKRNFSRQVRNLLEMLKFLVKCSFWYYSNLFCQSYSYFIEKTPLTKFGTNCFIVRVYFGYNKFLLCFAWEKNLNRGCHHFGNKVLYPKVLLFYFQNGISDKTDNALRHLCAKLIRIFVQWSLKKTKIDIRRHRVPVNVEAVIQKMCFFCVLPCSYNKLGTFFFNF